jgi:hypothetical protein
MRSSARTVDSQCAIMIAIRPASRRLIAFCVSASDSESRLDLASSSITIGAPDRNVRGDATPWRSPPDSLTRRSSTKVAGPHGKRAME